MKKIILLSFVSLFLVACGGNDTTTTSTNTGSTNNKAYSVNITSGNGTFFAATGGGIEYYFNNGILVQEATSSNLSSGAYLYNGSSIISTVVTLESGKVQNTRAFISPSTGTYVSSLNGGSQTGIFSTLNNTGFPDETLVGKDVALQMLYGTNTLASAGIATSTFSETTYTIKGDGINMGDSNGTYTYSRNSSSGYSQLIVNNSITGLSYTYILIYKDSNSGAFATRNDNDGQAGLFRIVR